jgi:NAD(P)-dependent dehydrogenase (short-subunit alcohol dehydrogenase family)
MLAVTGFRTSIVRALTARTGEPVERIHANLDDNRTDFLWPEGCERFVLAAGILYPMQVHDLHPHHIDEALSVNLTNVLRLCEKILRTVPRARIVVIGSVSAREGSFDQLYAAAKAGVHCYVQTRLVRPPQLLACVAPTIVSDAGMTLRRADYPAVLARRPSVTSDQVAEMVAAFLYADAAQLERLNNSIRFMEGVENGGE